MSDDFKIDAAQELLETLALAKACDDSVSAAAEAGARAPSGMSFARVLDFPPAPEGVA